MEFIFWRLAGRLEEEEEEEEEEEDEEEEEEDEKDERPNISRMSFVAMLGRRGSCRCTTVCIEIYSKTVVYTKYLNAI